MLDAAVTSAQAAIDNDDLLAAAVALSSINKLGAPDELGSYAKAAVQAGKLYQDLQGKIEERVEKSRVLLTESNPDNLLDPALALCEAEAAYKMFPKTRRQAAVLTRQFRSNDAFDDTFAQADALVRARSMRAALDRRVKGRAIRAYTDLMRRYPGTEVDKLARTELQEFAPEAEIPDSSSLAKTTTSPTPTDFRTWTARRGNFSTKAKYLQQKAGMVQLQKEDGAKIVVEISVLSDADQAFLRQQAK